MQFLSGSACNFPSDKRRAIVPAACSRERFPGLIPLAAIKVGRDEWGKNYTANCVNFIRNQTGYISTAILYTPLTPTMANYESTFIRDGQTLFNFHHHGGWNYYRLLHSSRSFLYLISPSLFPSLSLSLSLFAASSARWERNRARMVIWKKKKREKKR